MWFANQRGAMRILAEREAMRSHFPSFRLMQLKGGRLAWRGQLRLKGGSIYLISAELPARYPYQPPVLHVLSPALAHGCPHRYADGSLCVYLNNWNPASGTVVQTIANAADWLRHYQGWRRMGAWRS
jgi:ubiquitin-protein ligase